MRVVLIDVDGHNFPNLPLMKIAAYRAFELYFMQGWDYGQIAEELDTGKNTPRRWVTAIINELSVLLWGIDEDRVK